MTVAFIPVRGGSKSIPLKNIKEINGKPLVYWAVKAAVECRQIDRIYVSTDSNIIRSVVEAFGFDNVTVIDRSIESASDTASTESAMIEFANQYVFDNIVLIQATSPLLSTEDLYGGIELFNSPDCDSVLSVVRQYRFLWDANNDAIVSPINYDVYNRPRRQDFSGYLMENGAFYITTRSALLNYKNRISGRIKAYEMPEDTAFEIDEPTDWIIIDKLMKRRKPLTFPKIKMLLTDCDGCLTDGGMYYSENGDELKKFNTKDGMGFSLLKEQGIIIGIITGENTELNRRRALKLNVDELHMGVKDKLTVVKQLSEKYGIQMKNIAYIGDDLNDLEVIQSVGLGCCPADAVKEVRDIALYTTKSNGGQGVIREVVDLIYGVK